MQFGGVKNVTVLRDRATGVSKGCAFVSLDDAEQASKAIDFLDRKVFLTGALRPLEVSQRGSWVCRVPPWSPSGAV